MALQRLGCTACTCLQRQYIRQGCSWQAISSRRRAHKLINPEFPDNRFSTVYRDIHGSVEDSSTARDFIFALKPHERTLLYNELKSFESENESVKGTTEVHPPTSGQLKRVTLHNAIPFIGFGFLDNFIMIMAGEYIDTYFGAVLGISTMAAAALGNWLSDLAGVGTAHYVEYVFSKFGVRSPALLPEQVDMKQTRWASNVGRAVGISIGCILGMFPLLFMKGREDEDSTEDKS
ncbi:transmembrane protein 65-like [Argopecten irradians]|uniref:transmembrane protein 65-like n=1 Tax=Argopecten irradians TaxID=31199 RepID=UPI00371299EE